MKEKRSGRDESELEKINEFAEFLFYNTNKFLNNHLDELNLKSGGFLTATKHLITISEIVKSENILYSILALLNDDSLTQRDRLNKIQALSKEFYSILSKSSNLLPLHSSQLVKDKLFASQILKDLLQLSEQSFLFHSPSFVFFLSSFSPPLPPSSFPLFPPSSFPPSLPSLPPFLSFLLPPFPLPSLLSSLSSFLLSLSSVPPPLPSFPSVFPP